MSATTIQVCADCKLASDRAWKTYKHPQYGLIWQEVGVCRHCWQSAMYRMEKAAKEEVQAQSYREAF